MPISLELKAGSIALHIRYKVTSSGGQLSFVPHVPNFTDIMPSFFNELIILRIVTGLIPVDRARSSIQHCQVKNSFFLLFHTRNLADVL